MTEDTTGTDASGASAEVSPTRPVDCAPHAFAAIAESAPQCAVAVSLDCVSKLRLSVAAELGHRTLLLGDVVQFTKGTIIELDRLAGEPVDIVIAGRVICQGEVVTVNAKRAIRLTDITLDELGHHLRSPRIGETGPA